MSQLTIAKPSEAEFLGLNDFLNKLEQLLQENSAEFQAFTIAEWLEENFSDIESSWRRVIWAGHVCIGNACDPNLNHLEFKPQLREFLEESKDVEPGDLW